MVENRAKYAKLGPLAMHVFDVITMHTLYAPNKPEQYGWVTEDASRISFLSEQTARSESTVRAALNDLETGGLIKHDHDPFNRRPGRGNPKRIRNNIAHHLLAESRDDPHER